MGLVLRRHPVTSRPPPNAGDQLLSVKEVADLTGMSRRTVWRWLAAGELEAVQLGRAVRIRKSALDAFLRRRRRRR